MEVLSITIGVVIGALFGFPIGILFVLNNERKVKAAKSAASTVADAIRKIRD